MTRSPAVFSSAALLLSVVSVPVAGCSFGENGIDPPINRIFLPAGIVADPVYPFLYVVNSNSDLRFNAGTVVAVDLARAAKTLTDARASHDTNPAIPTCSKTRFSRTEPVADDYCCRDLVDSNILNCNEPQFVRSEATVSIGSFGGAVELQQAPRPDDTTIRRLFMAVRAEPSITYADVKIVANFSGSDDGGASADGGATSYAVSMRCTGARGDTSAQPANAYCDDNWRIRRPGGATPGELVLPEEPHVLWLDPALPGILYVGHLTVTANAQIQGGGVSTLDICDPTSPNWVRFAGLAQTAFLPVTASQAVAALSKGDPAPPNLFVTDPLVYATARYSAQVTGMVLRTPVSPSQLTCPHPTTAPLDLTLVPGENFLSPAFLPNGSDVRGILFFTDPTGHPEAFVLHRNDSDTIANPPALVVLDRQALPDGTPANSVMGILDVCNGPTAMQMHNAGLTDRIYVTCYDDGEIYVIDPVALVVTAIIDVGTGPTSLVFSPLDPGIAYVASFANSHLSVIDIAPGSPTENHVVQRVGLPHGYGE